MFLFVVLVFSPFNGGLSKVFLRCSHFIAPKHTSRIIKKAEPHQLQPCLSVLSTKIISQTVDNYFITPCFCISALRASYDTSIPMRTLNSFLDTLELAFVGTRLLTTTYLV